MDHLEVGLMHQDSQLVVFPKCRVRDIAFVQCKLEEANS